METYQIARGERGTIEFKEHAEVKALLKHLHEYYALSWPAIAELPALNPPGADPIPFSTLAKIAKTGKVPEKWRARFGIGALDTRPRTMIHLENIDSAAATLQKHMSLEKRIELKKRLERQIHAERKAKNESRNL